MNSERDVAIVLYNAAREERMTWNEAINKYSDHLRLVDDIWDIVFPVDHNNAHVEGAEAVFTITRDHCRNPLNDHELYEELGI